MNPDDLEMELAEIKERLTRLESEAWRKAFPTAPMPILTTSADYCHVCWRKLSDMTNYVCSHPTCPSRITVTS